MEPWCFHGSAQTYSIDWFTIDGGGSTSTGGVYSVSGTIGQPDAGHMSGGNFTLDGGFWGIIGAVQIPGAQLLWVLLTSTNTVVVAWPAPSTGFSLQQNPDLKTTAWGGVTNPVNVVGSENQIIVAPPVGNRFYRLKNPDFQSSKNRRSLSKRWHVSCLPRFPGGFAYLAAKTPSFSIWRLASD
jgi:hypothetical protein